MKVLKFGGTSVGTVESLECVKNIVGKLNEETVVVVSALGGLTDRLISTAHLAACGDEGYTEEWHKMVDRHHDVVFRVISKPLIASTLKTIDKYLEELKRNYDGVALLRDLPDKILDIIVSFGERMSSVIVSAMIEGSTLHNSLDFIKTEKWFDRNIADTKLTNSLILKEFGGELSKIHIVPGFISTDRDTGEITNLGRGGSDYTAALIAAALNSDVLEIWTDVDGFMTADPRIIKDAEVLAGLSFIESMELCTFGAKVIYPPTIYPVFHKNIPIKILNTFNSDAPGTLITDSKKSGECIVKGVTSLKNISLVSITGKIADNVAEINSRSYNALARRGISVYLLSQAEDEGHFSFAVGSGDVEETLSVLNEEFAPELFSGKVSDILSRKNLSTIAVVGENIKKLDGAGERVRNTLLRDGIEVIASSFGVSETTMTFVVNDTDTDKSLQLIHSLFFNR